jgi:hypothetical protein
MKLLLAFLLALAQAAQAAAPKVVVSKVGLSGAQNVTLAKPGILNNGFASPLGNSGLPNLAPSISPVPVLDGLTNVVNKQAELGQDQGNEKAVLGGSLFDGAKAKLGSAGDPVDGSASAGDPSRSSGLSPPTREEVEQAYRSAVPSPRALSHFASQFPEVAAEVLYKFTFVGQDMLANVAEAARFQPQAEKLLGALNELIGVHEARGDSAATKFLETLGAWYAGGYHTRQKDERRGQPHMTPNPLEGGEYWDMAAGMNAGGYINREIDSKSDYSFFDISPFVVSFLNETARQTGKSNAKAVKADLLQLQKPAKPLSVLRSKNAIAYVPGFGKKLEEMADWIAPGGQLVIQNDPNPGQRSLITGDHGPLIQRLIAEGWDMQYGFSGDSGPLGKYGYDTLVLTRPIGPRQVESLEAAARWKDYVRAVQKADDRFDPFGGLFGALFGR